MRAYITMKIEKPLILPMQNNHIIQAIILKWIGDDAYRKYIHDKGYEYKSRRYKMYTFSRLEGKFKLDRVKKTVTYFDEVRFILSSSDEKFLNYVVNTIMYEDSVDFYGTAATVLSVKCLSYELSGKTKVYTKSPITVYSTLTGKDIKKTYYYNPRENEFEEFIRRNLMNKYAALYDKQPGNMDFFLKPVDVLKLKQCIVIYKGTVIKGWNGEFFMDGSSELLNLAYNSGLGSKNSQGFGCIEICRKE